MARRTIAIALILAGLWLPQRAEASCGGSAGSGPQAACESIASSDIWMYLWLDFINVLAAGGDLGITWGKTPPPWPAHPMNIGHHAVAGLTILAGYLGKDTNFGGLARGTLYMGLTSEAIAVVNTFAIIARHHKQRRIERRIETGR